REVSRMRNEKYQLPGSPEARRALLARLFETYPQMENAFLTVQHRDFKALSDGDVESFLRQLQELGAYPTEASEPKEAMWAKARKRKARGLASLLPPDQQPETD